MHFRRQCVDRIKHAVIRRRVKESFQIVVFEKLVADLQIQRRIDRKQTFRHCFRLGLTDGVRRGDELAVPVGILHDIAVHDGESADGGPGEKFRCDPADAAESDAQNVCVCDSFESLFTEKKLRPGLPAGVHFRNTRLKFSAICSLSSSTSQSRSSAAA